MACGRRRFLSTKRGLEVEWAGGGGGGGTASLRVGTQKSYRPMALGFGLQQHFLTALAASVFKVSRGPRTPTV